MLEFFNIFFFFSLSLSHVPCLSSPPLSFFLLLRPLLSSLFPFLILKPPYTLVFISRIPRPLQIKALRQQMLQAPPLHLKNARWNTDEDNVVPIPKQHERFGVWFQNRMYCDDFNLKKRLVGEDVSKILALLKVNNRTNRRVQEVVGGYARKGCGGWMVEWLLISLARCMRER